MKDALKQTLDALIATQKQISSMDPDDRMALGEALASALRQAGMLDHFELNTARGFFWKIDAHSLALRVDASSRFDDDIPF